MDYLTGETISIITGVSSIIFFIIACAIFLINYFHVKEAKKMEKRLNVFLPGGVTVAMSFHLFVSTIFVFFTAILLFLV